jgi:hypothetical protein
MSDEAGRLSAIEPPLLVIAAAHDRSTYLTRQEFFLFHIPAISGTGH